MQIHESKRVENKILIIDDDSEFSNLLKALLASGGYRVEIVNDPKQGIRIAREKTPGLILLDALMPEMNGREVLEALQRDNAGKNIPVILLTGKTSSDDYAGERKAGATACLLKPVDSKKLLETIKQILT